MSLLIASLTVDDLSGLEERAADAFGRGADAVELRIDGFHGDPAALNAILRRQGDREWVVTCRCRAEGGRSNATPRERAEMLLQVAAGTRAYVDFEYAAWRGSAEARETLAQTARLTTDGGSRLILSAHDFAGTFDDPAALVANMLAEPHAAVAKIAYTASSIQDSWTALDLMRRHGSRVVAIAMGEDGAWTRVLAKKLGAFGTYCAADARSETAPGQLSLDEMVAHFRWPRVDANTRVFGVVGDPVAHSMSPLLFNHWFDRHDVNAVYFPLHVRGASEEIHDFLQACADRAWLDFAGCSITIPHKASALRWAGNGADAMTKAVGAANTLVMRDGRVGAFNTDCYAAIDSLCAALGCVRADLAKLRVDILGAGGACRAVVHGLREFGCRGRVYARHVEKARKLAAEFYFDAAPWERRAQGYGDVLINATSVGMWPDVEESPMPPDALPGRRLVFDLVYNPAQTKLLRDAEAAGVAVLNGLDMFVRQAAMQFNLWTGVHPDIALARRCLAERDKLGECR